MDCIVHRVTKSRMQLRDFHFLPKSISMSIILSLNLFLQIQLYVFWMYHVLVKILLYSSSITFILLNGILLILEA